MVAICAIFKTSSSWIADLLKDELFYLNEGEPLYLQKICHHSSKYIVRSFCSFSIWLIFMIA